MDRGSRPNLISEILGRKEAIKCRTRCMGGVVIFD